MRTITLNIEDAPPLDEREEAQVQSYLALVTPLFEQLPLPIMAEAVARTVYDYLSWAVLAGDRRTEWRFPESTRARASLANPRLGCGCGR
jgi:hypothetical protein